MKVLITGAAGGIGSTLGYELYKNRYDTILIDNFRNGYRENLLIDEKPFGKFYEMDIRDTESVYKLLVNENIECVIHLAAITALPDCEINKSECIDINVNGTVSILQACKKAGIKNVLFSSTSAVYEKNKIEEAPYTEDLNINPKLFYSLSKKMAEDVCISYNENYNMNIKILRFFNVVGPRQDIHRTSPPLINYMVKCFINGEKPILHSDGTQLRDYVYVNDVVDFIKLIIEKNTKDTIFNICTGKLISVNDIVRYTQEELKCDIIPIYRDSSMLWDSYPNLFNESISLSKSVVSNEVNKFCLGSNIKSLSLGWKPTIDIEYIIKLTVRKIKENLEITKK